MKRAFLLITLFALAGCGDETSTTPGKSPATAPSASATTTDKSDSDAQATSGLIEIPTTAPSR